MKTAPAAGPTSRKSAFKNKHSTYERDPLDFYVEPAWCTELLIDALPGWERVWDPACGSGTVVKTCLKRRIYAVGSDIVERWEKSYVGDFLTSKGPLIDDPEIITNPPYSLAEAFIRRAHEIRARKIAVLVRLDFLSSLRRHKLFTEDHPPQFVLVLSRRPSMPPGNADEVTRKHERGQNDYCWIVWDSFRARHTNCEVRWLK